jgi:mono/diheme cytochrome c family protein
MKSTLVRRIGLIAAICFVIAFGFLLCWFPPWSANSSLPGSVPRLLLFVGRFHLVVLHFPVALLPLVAALHIWARWPSGAPLRSILGPLRWLAFLSAMLAASTGLLLARGGGYRGSTFEWHWRFTLAMTTLCLIAAFLYYFGFRGVSVLRGLLWTAILGTLGAGAHLGGSLTHGKDFLSEYAPTALKPILSFGPGEISADSAAISSPAPPSPGKTAPSPAPSPPANPRVLVTATALAVTSLAANAQSPESAELARKVDNLFRARCAACHESGAPEKAELLFVGNLGLFAAGDEINSKVPEDSRLYQKLLRDMPKLTTAERAAGQDRPKRFDPDEMDLVLRWIKAGGPVPGGTQLVAAAGATPPSTSPPSGSAGITPSAPAAIRAVVSDGEVFAAALQDILSQPAADRSDYRYLSLAPLHNNAEDVSDSELKLASEGITKLLNSLSSNPKVLTFPPVGSQGVLRRIKLRDLGWSAAEWDELTGIYPYALDSDALKSLGGPTQCAVPLVRADWFAATASRPPLYDRLINTPKSVTELEERLGVDLKTSLANGDAIRSGFSVSGIARQNRLVERYEIKRYSGAFWQSYDFLKDTERGQLTKFPLGPVSAHLFGGEFAFEHAGGEIIYNLPNGFQAYLLVNGKGDRLDKVAPSEIVEDRSRKTPSTQVSNGLSCIACHSAGMITLPDDELRAVANSARFAAEPAAARLIEELHPPQEQIRNAVETDKQRFLAALQQADLPIDSSREPVLALVDFFEREVTTAQAAAEFGLTKADFEQKLEAAGGSLLDERSELHSPGIKRVNFPDAFNRIAVRLGFGSTRSFAEAPETLRRILDPFHSQDVDPARLGVEVRTDKATYRKGDLMLVTVQTSEDAYVRLLYQDAEGNVKTLLPNAAHDGRIKGGRPVIFGDDTLINPETGKAFRLRVGPPYGQEILAAVVSNTPFKNDAEVLAAARNAKGIADGQAKSRAKGVEVEIVDAVRQRAVEGRIGVARVKIVTAE